MRVLLAILALALAARPAEPCTGCKPPTVAKLFSESVRVYAGTVASVDKNKLVITVDTVWKGDVAAQQTFGTSCWFALKPNTKLIIMDRGGKPMYWISECLGVSRDNAAQRAALAKLAPPHAP